MKKITSIIICTILISALVGCSSNIDNNNDIPIIGFHGSYAYYYSVEELFDRADLVAEVKVNENIKTELIVNLPFTTSNVEVKEVYKGEINKKDVIQVNELGGVFRPYLFGDPNQPQHEEAVEMRVEGVPVMQPGDKQIIFAKLDDELKDGSYTIFALWQGKFKINGDKVNRGVDKHKEVNENFIFENVTQLKEKIKKLKEKKEKVKE